MAAIYRLTENEILGAIVRYKRGESLDSIRKSLSVSTTMLRRNFVEGGVVLRTPQESAALAAKKRRRHGRG